MKIFNEVLPDYNVIGKKEIANAVKVLETGKLSGFIAAPGKDYLGGYYVQALEEAFCEKFNCKYAVSLNSATSALHAALVASNIGNGDEVIVPTWSMSASATSIVMAGATPIFVDIEPDYFCLDIKKVLPLLTNKTKAIMVVNLFGLPASLREIRQICDENNLVMIEDNSQAPAAMHDGQFTGSYGDISIYSLNRHKTIQCGEGGVAVTNKDSYLHRLRLVRNHGEAVFPELEKEEQEKGGDDIIGYNYRLTSLQAAIAYPQVKKIDKLNQHRIDLANLLDQKLEKIDFLQKPAIRNNSSHVYYLYSMIFNDKKAGFSRDEFIKRMKNEGAPISEYVRPLYRIPLFQKKCGNLTNCDINNFPVTEKLWSQTLVTTSICRPPLDEKHLDLFIKAIQKVSQK